MKIIVLIFSISIALLAGDYFLTSAGTMRAGWNSSMNSPNYSCNFDEDCAITDLNRIDVNGSSHQCPNPRCVAKNWQPTPFPLSREMSLGVSQAYALSCGQPVDYSPSCVCENYQCKFGPVENNQTINK